MENIYYKVTAACNYDGPTAEYVFLSRPAAERKFAEMLTEVNDPSSEVANCDDLVLSQHAFGEDARCPALGLVLEKVKEPRKRAAIEE